MSRLGVSRAGRAFKTAIFAGLFGGGSCNHVLPAGAVRGFVADVGSAWFSLLGRKRFMCDVRAETSDVINLVAAGRAVVSVRVGYRL